jgi:zinc D-Ala-D-Ala carboxypeptidase
MRNICKYITYEEAINSQTAIRNKIDNTPKEAELICMQLVGIRVFDVVREHFRTPLRVSSFYRSELLNKAIARSSKTSQHVKGQAIDIQGTGVISNKMIFDYIKEHLDFDQLIWEFGNKNNPAWVHVSYVSKQKNRKQILYIGVK